MYPLSLPHDVFRTDDLHRSRELLQAKIADLFVDNPTQTGLEVISPRTSAEANSGNSVPHACILVFFCTDTLNVHRCNRSYEFQDL